MGATDLQRTVRRATATVTVFIAGAVLLRVRTTPATSVGRLEHALLELFAQVFLWGCILYLVLSVGAELLGVWDTTEEQPTDSL